MIFCKNLLERFEIDDPLTASPIHFGGGLVGILLTPIFKNDGLIGKKQKKNQGRKFFLAFDICPVQELAYIGNFPSANSSDFRCDFYEWKVFGWNVVGMLTITVWTAALSTAVFWSLKKLKMLRIPASAEKYGLDRLKHGEDAYPLDGYFG
jgi:Amt family ammonium transporter